MMANYTREWGICAWLNRPLRITFFSYFSVETMKQWFFFITSLLAVDRLLLGLSEGKEDYASYWKIRRLSFTILVPAPEGSLQQLCLVFLHSLTVEEEESSWWKEVKKFKTNLYNTRFPGYNRKPLKLFDWKRSCVEECYCCITTQGWWNNYILLSIHYSVWIWGIWSGYIGSSIGSLWVLWAQGGGFVAWCGWLGESRTRGHFMELRILIGWVIFLVYFA